MRKAAIIQVRAVHKGEHGWMARQQYPARAILCVSHTRTARQYAVGRRLEQHHRTTDILKAN